uniref:Uncharacterized protein n=1 Tax=Anguilla anguilla TaxID=7936 RepID=A0A0E9S345_ANGAN
MNRLGPKPGSTVALVLIRPVLTYWTESQDRLQCFVLVPSSLTLHSLC